MFDIWNTPEEEMGMKKISKNRVRDRNQLNKSKDSIRRVVVPQSGQSYNPPITEHQKVIDQVVVEEIEDIRKEVQLEQELNPNLRPEMETLPEEIQRLKDLSQRKTEKSKKGAKKKPEEVVAEVEVEAEVEADGEGDGDGEGEREREVEGEGEGESDQDGPTQLAYNPPADRKNALTPKQRKKREIHRQTQKERLREKKMRQVVHKNLPKGKKYMKKLRQIKEYNKDIEVQERAIWETDGVVSKARKLGMYKYSKPKVDFVPEEELPESFRNQKGTDNLIRDQFDSFYRRNLMPKEAPPNDRKKIKGVQYKQHNTTSTKRNMRDQEKMGDKALQQAREKLRLRKRQTALIRGVKPPKEGKDDEEELIMI